jgi:methylated-DNA-[protein]-cysteine S-methyltransferase
MGETRCTVGERYCLFETGFGTCGIAWSDAGVVRLQLPERTRERTAGRIRLGDREEADVPPRAVGEVIGELVAYFAGQRIDFSGVAVDLSRVPAFHRSIYGALRKVGWGETATYGELARRAGAPGAARAVGQAMGRNPVPIIIPCHRVLAAGGKIGGFSAYGGAVTKERLLALEGVHPSGTPQLPGLLPAAR